MTDARFGPGCASVPADGKGSFAGMAKEPVATAASNNPLLSTLVAAVKKAGLVDTLNNSKNITVFAPSNSAFDKIPKADLDKVLADKTTLTHLLTHHVVPSRLAPAALAGTHPTLNSDSVVSGTTPDFDVVGAKDHRGGQRDDLAGGLYESSGDFGGAGGANPQPAHPEGGASVDPHLAKLTPVVLVDGLADDLRRRGEVGRQLGLGALKWSLLTCAPPASPSRNASTRTYSLLSSRLRDHSNHRQPSSARVASVKAREISAQASACSGRTVNLAVMKIKVCLLRLRGWRRASWRSARRRRSRT